MRKSRLLLVLALVILAGLLVVVVLIGRINFNSFDFNSLIQSCVASCSSFLGNYPVLFLVVFTFGLVVGVILCSRSGRVVSNTQRKMSPPQASPAAATRASIGPRLSDSETSLRKWTERKS